MPYVIERNGKYYSGENRHKSVWVGDKADALASMKLVTSAVIKEL